jgi:hypothetical protein
MKYLLLTVEDAQALAASPETNIDLQISASVNADTGGDFADIANQLKKLEICCACSHESMSALCVAPLAQKLGRRLQRLIDRADNRRADKYITSLEQALNARTSERR